MLEEASPESYAGPTRTTFAGCQCAKAASRPRSGLTKYQIKFANAFGIGAIGWLAKLAAVVGFGA